MARAWIPGTYNAQGDPGTGGFVVDMTDRNDVLSFWKGVYFASEGYEDRLGWTGNYNTAITSGGPGANPLPAGAEGSISTAFIRDTERRVNFYRALAGVPADVKLNTGRPVQQYGNDLYQFGAGETVPTKSAAAQRSAYMIIRTYGYNQGGTIHSPLGASRAMVGMSHSPPTDAVGWNKMAWNGNAKSNLSFGAFGPGAIDRYMKENIEGVSSWNTSVGHRRWVIYRYGTDYATGDTPGSYNASSGIIRPATNALYVIPHEEEKRLELPSSYVPYPPAGYFPAPLNSQFWSLSYPAADFSNATVRMNPNVSATIVSRAPGYGESSLVWQVGAAAAAQSVNQDTTFQVTVAGVRGEGVPPSFTYFVTLINPLTMTEDQSLLGTDNPHHSVPARYFFDRPSGAEAVEVNSFRPTDTGWLEGAEDATVSLPDGSDSVTDGTADSYELRVRVTQLAANYPSNFFRTGQKAFHLTFPTLYDLQTQGVPEQRFELNREILPAAGSRLQFYYRRAYMTSSSSLRVEITQDDGATWSQLGNDIVGTQQGSPDDGFVLQSLALPTTTEPVRVRFRYFVSGTGGIYDLQNFPASAYTTGIFIDDITTSGARWLDLKKRNSLPVGTDYLVFNETTAGGSLSAGEQRYLRMRTQLGRHWFPYGPSAKLTCSAVALEGFEAWSRYQHPYLSGGFTDDALGKGIPNGILYAFFRDPLHLQLLPDEISLEGNLRLSIRRPLAELRADVEYGAERSNDLQNWSSEGVTIEHTGGYLKATAPAGARFLRWSVRRL